MTSILATGPSLPQHYYTQEEIQRALVELWSGGAGSLEMAAVEHFFRAVGVRGRHLAMPKEAYAHAPGLAARNRAWIETALELGQSAVSKALERAELEASDLNLLMTTTVTGISVPAIDVALMNRLGLSPNTKRVPLFGLGCVAGAAGIARVHDYLAGHPRETAALLSVELCSLTLQCGDTSTANIVASSLFGDGAAAVVFAGADHPASQRARGPRVLGSRSVLFPNSERVMGWDVIDAGFKIVLSNRVPYYARHEMPKLIADFLSEWQLGCQDIDVWLAHPGGPAVIRGMEEGLELCEGALDLSREVLARTGNLSSATVLVMLDQVLSEEAPPPGSYGLLCAMGPGFCAELVLLKW